jgi:hypothetical protein
MSLILIGQFVQTQDGNASIASALEGNTLSAFLTSQIAGLISQVFEGVDVNVKAPAMLSQDANANPDWGVTVSTNLGERLSLSGSVETQTRRKQVDPNASSYVGDFDVQYRIDKQGRLRLKAFSHANDQYVEMVQTNSNRVGVGLIYQEDFDDFADLWQALFHRKRQQDSLRGVEKKE